MEYDRIPTGFSRGVNAFLRIVHRDALSHRSGMVLRVLGFGV